MVQFFVGDCTKPRGLENVGAPFRAVVADDSEQAQKGGCPDE